MNVLLLDDEPIELDQLEWIIAENYPEWHITKAQNGSDAISIIGAAAREEKLYQLALIDIKLPGKNGLEIAKEMKQTMKGLDIIVISAYGDFEYAKESIHLKVVDYLLKPVIKEELLGALKNYIKNHPEYQISSEIVQKVIHLIQTKYHENLKLSTIANGLHINSNYLSRLFHDEVGVSFSDYLLHHRIEVAKGMLLKKREWSIQRIAEECGFNSQHYFSTTFKKYTQKSPKDFRNVVG